MHPARFTPVQHRAALLVGDPGKLVHAGKVYGSSDAPHGRRSCLDEETPVASLDLLSFGSEGGSPEGYGHCNGTENAHGEPSQAQYPGGTHPEVGTE
jgi:hypothetical protein